MSLKSDFGCLYVATGKKYLDEAIRSALLSKKWTHSHPIYISTDLTDEAESSGVFDSVLKHPNPVYSYRDKIVSLIRPPFRHTLFLDTDAFLVSPLEDIFAFTSNLDFAAACAPVCHPPGWSDPVVPNVFGELNTGVIFLKKSPKQRSVIKSWLRLYDARCLSHNQIWDQATFRSVIWDSIVKLNLRFLTLPDECNLRTTKPWIAGRGQRVYVIHGRFPVSELDPFEKYLNTDIDRFRTSSEWIYLNPESQIYPKFDRSIRAL